MDNKKLKPEISSLEEALNQLSSNPDFLEELSKIHKDKLITGNKEKNSKQGIKRY